MAYRSSLTNEHAFGVDDAPYISFPSPVPGLGHLNQALMGHSCQAPKASQLPKWNSGKLPSGEDMSSA